MKKNLTLLLFMLCISFSIAEAQSNFVGAGVTLKFNGSSGNYVDLGDVYSSLAFPFTVEAWVNPLSYPTLYGGIFGSDNDQSNYNGFWIRVRNTGLLEIEFGNGLGSGAPFKRGFATTATVPLNRWTHVAVTCESITDVHFYFNGVEQTKAPDDGSATQTTLTHSIAHASIGRTINFFNENNFNGSIDEVRLWNISRSQDDIRIYMCKKVDPASSGLIGYWTSDESYTSDTVNDNTTPAENGTITGTVEKVTSGAAIGDVSKYIYTSSWASKKINVPAATTLDKFTAKTIKGNPYGVQVYRVDGIPYSVDGTGTIPSYYFGVFCAESGTTATYKLTYTYSTSNGVTSTANEDSCQLRRKYTDSTIDWVDLKGTLDTIGNTITKTNQATRKEYILDVLPNYNAKNILDNPTTSPRQLSLYPNPVSQKISVSLINDDQSVSMIRIEDLTGRILKVTREINQEQPIQIDVSDLKSGTYLVAVLTTSGWSIGKFEVQK